MLENLTQKQKIVFAIIITLMVVVIIYYIYSRLNEYNLTSTSEDVEENLMFDNTSDKDTSDDLSEKSQILIHISGCVKNNTVVILPEGSRINDAIEAAGGLTSEADLTNINLAYILEDGEKIYIPKKGEELSDYTSSSSSSEINLNTSSSSTSSKNTKININKAQQAELETIPGIGPTTATKIIAYREGNGKFKTIEDIKNVSGIGDAKYEKMKEYITVK